MDQKECHGLLEMALRIVFGLSSLCEAWEVKTPRRRQSISRSLPPKGAQTEWRMVTNMVMTGPACRFSC